MVSEENDETIIVPHTGDGEAGRYVIVFDPLDGSSNIDCNVRLVQLEPCD
jgi:fructose-1,6-bisphosphatase I